jgi:solute:Na+ symporter, SSS family
MLKTKIGILIFSIIALCFSVIVIDQLVLLARVSFAGTALMGPMILLGILSERKHSPIIILLSFLALVIFLLSLAGIVPGNVAGIRLDLLLFILLGIAALITYWTGVKNEKKVDERMFS